MEASSSFDLFLSYNTRDREPVLRVQAALRERGITTFLDCQHLTVGLNWRDEIETALTQVNSVAVFIGGEGFGRVQRGEKNLALDRQEAATKEGRKFPVIPILLPGAKPDDVTGFLSQNTWIDLRTGLENAAAMDAIAHAIKGEAIAAQVAPPEPLCPYRGLLAFTEDDAPLFYGRDAFADDLLCKARTLKLIAVVGPSGTGKSSVVQAGLLPRLRRERAPNATWEALIFRPGNRPFHNLANELVALYETSLSKTDQMLAANKLGEAFANHELPLDAPIAEALKATQWANRLLFIVDQFEELFTLTEEKDRKPFVNLLLNATAIAPLTIVLTLRADFYSQSISVSRELSDAIQQGIVNIGYVKREELRRAIVKPAESVGLQFEDGLVDRILDNLEAEPGNLPLLEFALTELWEKRQGNRVTNQLYEDIGGVGGSLGKRAEEVFTSLSHTQQELALRAFTRLVRVAAASEEGTDTRQRVNLQDFNDATQKVIQGFVKARLLVTNRNEATNEEIVEVAHEALIKNWDRLKDALSKDREFLLWRQRLNFLLAEWQHIQEETGKERDGLLQGHQLNEAKRWSKSRHDELNAQEIEFIRKSEKAAKQPKKWLAAAGVVLLIAVLTAWGWKVWDDRPASQISKIIADANPLVLVDDNKSRGYWLKNLVITGRHDVALAASRNVEEIKSRTIALADVAEALVQTRQLDIAKTAANEARSLAISIENKDSRNNTLMNITKALAQTGQVQEALAIINENETNQSGQANALADVAKALAQAEQPDKAKTIADDALAALRNQDITFLKRYPQFRSRSPEVIAKVFAQAGMTREAIAALSLQYKQLLSSDEFIDDGIRSIGINRPKILQSSRIGDIASALAGIAKALAQAGQINAAIMIADEAYALTKHIEEEKAAFHSSVLADIAVAFAQAGQHQKALIIAQGIEYPVILCDVLVDVAKAFAQANRIEDAQKTVSAAIVVAKDLDGRYSRSTALADVAITFAQIHQVESAKTTIAETLTLIYTLEDNNRSGVYLGITQALAKLHDYRAAREMARNCTRSDDKLRAYTAILREYAIDQEKISPKLFEQLDRENERKQQ
jgi:hypothetical protein